MNQNRRSFLGWMVAASGAIVIAGGYETARSAQSADLKLRSEHSDPGKSVPSDLMVIISGLGKTFHIPACTFIHGKTRLQTIAADEARRLGYAPCVRCMREYLG